MQTAGQPIEYCNPHVCDVDFTPTSYCVLQHKIRGAFIRKLLLVFHKTATFVVFVVKYML